MEIENQSIPSFNGYEFSDSARCCITAINNFTNISGCLTNIKNNEKIRNQRVKKHNDTYYAETTVVYQKYKNGNKKYYSIVYKINNKGIAQCFMVLPKALNKHCKEEKCKYSKE